MADASAPRDEHPQSRALRRLDWRFLLGVAPDARVAHNADAALTTAARTLFSDSAPLGDNVVADREVVVLSDPSPEALRSAFAALQPGGVCYAEFNLPRLGGHERRRATLRDAGFEGVEAYWMWPPPRRRSPQFWVSQRAGGAIDHLLATRPTPRSRRGRFAAAGARATWQVGRRAGLLAPLGVIGRRPGQDGTRATFTDEIRRGWTTWGLGDVPGTISYVMLTGGRSRLNKVVVLVFADEDDTPRLAIKLARVEEAAAGLRREVSALTRVADRQVTAVAVPQVVFCRPFAGTLAIGETPLIGQPVIAALDRSTHAPLAERVTDALIALGGGADLDDAGRTWERVVAPVLDDFAARFEFLVGAACIDEVRRDLEHLPPLPVVPEHRDCSPWNVVVTGDDRLGLLDWESAEPDGLPLLDLVYFLANATFLVDGALGSGQEPSSYRTMLDPRSASGRTFAGSVARYCRALAIDDRAIAPLRRFTWMVHAPGEHDRILAESPGLSRDEAARRSVFAALFLEDVTEASRS